MNADRPNAAGLDARPETTLAVLLRLVRWQLDDVAHDLPAGRVSAEQRAELAATLDQLASMVRAVPIHIDGTGP